MTFNADDLPALKEALLTGATSISSAGRTVNFRSLNEIKAIIKDIEASIASQDPDNKIVSTSNIRGTFIPRKRIY